MVMGKKLIIILSLLIIALAGCSDEIETPSGISDLPSQPETPRGLTASIGNGQIVLEWTVTNPAAIDRYVVYFSDSATTGMMVFDTTALDTDTVDGLVNGRTYFFRVSVIDNDGLEGIQSSAVAGMPGIFSISIETGRPYTNDRSVTINLIAPEGTNLVQLSEDPAFNGAHWEIYGNNKSFELSDEDGAKIVYARFEMNTGGISVDAIFDDIVLDRKAEIDTVMIFVDDTQEVLGDTLLLAGDTLRFEIHVSEEGSAASIDIAGLGTVELNDFGIGGDKFPEDDIFGAEFIIPDETELFEAGLTARFTDVAGNHAPDVISSVRLSVTSSPTPVTVWGYSLSSLEIQLLWTQSEINDFLLYRIFRSTDITPPFTDSMQVIQISQANDAQYLDSDLEDDTKYWYWIYVDDTHGNSARSNDVAIQTPANEPPDTLTIFAATTGDTLSAKITWPKASEAEDFEAYYIFRDITDLPTYAGSDHISYPEDKAVEFIHDQQTTSFVDSDLPDSGTYYYQVYVVDKQGMVSRSNQATVFVP
jgi:fibronectin type 3 domain-containing protein